jgi:23S rRNA pseudouridine1911/1915/1917 synthase
MIEMLYEDDALVVCEKQVGVLSQPDASGMGEDMLSLLAEQLRCPSDKKAPYVGLVHRLDRGVGGVMVFAKRPEIAGRLSVAVAEHRMTKQYLAVVHGCPD